MARWLPPAALSAELSRNMRLLEDAQEAHRVRGSAAPAEEPRRSCTAEPLCRAAGGRSTCRLRSRTAKRPCRDHQGAGSTCNSASTAAAAAPAACPLPSASPLCFCPTLPQKAVEALVRVQARLDHTRNGAAAKQAARDAAAARQAAADEELQVGWGRCGPALWRAATLLVCELKAA